jgi:hypothetical protein
MKLELKNNSKYNEIQIELEKIKLEHQREIEKLKNDYE